ncbi:carbon monoxide dehydrogenase [Saccharomonospora sp. CUA-673]|uniref:xanthine dehydrogenase family protein molybdopterin-binding subunit n=1 Tax=Saccharomonospora sp. CUA-673 TaxID=1904969 RepID=UPI00095E905E|nr:xanthine dehydrogenase family protein molybdopterin-binding subunit [Saccharomonospora sp. CUA-673]OLT45902.1 carbon monoxide dehydrogenase [Saccharomonospora sp. CUA-673]
MTETEVRTTARPNVGTAVPRREDPQLLAGKGNWTGNIAPPGTVHVAVLRSPFARARIASIDVTEAAGMPGVVAVYTGADLADEWAGIPCAWPVTEDIRIPEHLPVAVDHVRFAGEAVAVVAAADAAAAQDALEHIDVDYEPADPALDVEESLAGGPHVHEEFGTNESYTWELATGEVDAAFAEADVHVAERYVQQRLQPTPMEQRAIVAVPEPTGSGFTLYSSTQIPHILRSVLAGVCSVPEQDLRVVAPDVGGGFGGKLNVYPEECIGIVLARRLSRPVKWVAGRTEDGQTMTHGRGQVQYVELAARNDGTLLGMRVRILADMGAYLQLLTPGIPLLSAFIFPGVYSFGAFSIECKGVFTNKTPTDSYRGAGRTEGIYGVERAMDALARRLGMDPAEVRRRNYHPPFDNGAATPAGLEMDSGNYPLALDKVLDLAGYDRLRAEQRRRREAGERVQLGIGLCSYTENGGLSPSKMTAALRLGAPGWEMASVRMLSTGAVQVVTGTSPHGQGHETTWAQIVADRLGVPMDSVQVVHSDTRAAPYGLDTYGSRSAAVGGTAVYLACEKVVTKARTLAAHMLEASEQDLEFTDGAFSVAGVSGGSSVTIQEVAGAAYLAADLPEGMEPGLSEEQFFDPPNFTYPFGTHICVVDVDTETGRVTIPEYYALDDCGTVINPAIVDGQMHGGIAQGIGQALYEDAVYDDDGNLTSASMADYLVPGAPDLPDFTLDHTVTPSPTNALGAKGAGESGSIASTPAVVNAVIDALQPLGVNHVDMPVTPFRVWEAITSAQRSSR